MEHEIAIVGGDGIGPEVVREGLKVLDAVATEYGFTLKRTDYPWCTQHYLDTGVILPDEALDEFRQLDAIYLGAIGDPRVEVGLIERGIIAGVRFGLDLYVNLRPIRLYHEDFCPIKDKTPADVDFVVVRENTEGAYAGIGGILKKGTPFEVATQEMIYTRAGCERVIRYAFEYARKRGKRKRLTLVDKANAIRAQDIWTRTFAEVGEEYPDIERDHGYVDATCMWMIKQPEHYDTMVTPNLFGDIITDLGAMLQGGMGIAASGNIHPGQVSMFEPIHGSAPKYAGQNKANPMGAIAAAQLMLDHLGEADAAACLESAIANLLGSGRIRSLSAGVHGTDEIGDLVVEEVHRLAAES
ncbi:MAG: 3-isopropylmalate dehydrogenase [Planctomycetota bacterium]